MKIIQKIKLYWEITFFLGGSFLLWPYFYLLSEINKKKSSRLLRFLVVQPAKIGDLTCTTPIFREIKKKYPDSYLAVMIIPMTRGVIQNNPYIDEIIEYDRAKVNTIGKQLQFIREISKRKFDWIFSVLSANVFVSLLGFWAGIPNRVATDSKSWWKSTQIANWFSNFKIEYCLHSSIPQHYLKLLKFIGINDFDEAKEVFNTEAEQKKADDILRKSGVSEGDFVVGICITAGNKLKEWAPSKFVELAYKLKTELSAKVIFIGGKSDCELIQKTLAETGDDFINLCGRFSLSELSALLRRLSIFVSGDTGPLYIANAAGTLIVDIAGPIDWREQPPLGERSEMVYSNEPCAPCSFVLLTARKCKRGDVKCLEIISVDNVYNAVLRLKNKFETEWKK